MDAGEKLGVGLMILLAFVALLLVVGGLLSSRWATPKECRNICDTAGVSYYDHGLCLCHPRGKELPDVGVFVEKQ